MTKKLSVLFLTIILALSVSITAFAAGTPTVKVSSAKASAGETVTLNVSITDNPGISSFAFGFSYDKTRLKLTDVELDSAIPGKFVYGKKAVWFNSKDIKTNGTYLKLTFKVLSTAEPGDAKVTVTYKSGDVVNYNEKNVSLTIVAGKVTVKEHTEHTYESTTTKATLTKNGKVTKKCTGCDYVKTTTVYSPKTFKLSTNEFTYNKEVKSPSVTVKDSKGNTLKKGTDYTVGYESGRKLPGKYTVKITLKGKYDGVKRLYFTIKPKAVSEITATQTITTVTLNWKSVTGADGYKVYMYKSSTGDYEYYKTTKSTSMKISDLKAGTGYKFKVRAYTNDEGAIYGSYSSVFSTATKTKTPSISSVTSSTKGKAIVKWSNVTGESGYQLYYSTSKDGTYKKVASYDVNKTAGSKSSLSSGKTYYFKVRAYKKTSSGTIYSSWSSVKSVKVK